VRCNGQLKTMLLRQLAQHQEAAAVAAAEQHTQAATAGAASSSSSRQQRYEPLPRGWQPPAPCVVVSKEMLRHSSASRLLYTPQPFYQQRVRLAAAVTFGLAITSNSRLSCSCRADARTAARRVDGCSEFPLGRLPRDQQRQRQPQLTPLQLLESLDQPLQPSSEVQAAAGEQQLDSKPTRRRLPRYVSQRTFLVWLLVAMALIVSGLVGTWAAPGPHTAAFMDLTPRAPEIRIQAPEQGMTRREQERPQFEWEQEGSAKRSELGCGRRGGASESRGPVFLLMTFSATAGAWRSICRHLRMLLAAF